MILLNFMNSFALSYNTPETFAQDECFACGQGEAQGETGQTSCLGCAAGRVLHSSTFWLNLSAFCGIGGVCRGCLGDVYEVLRGLRGDQGVFRVYFVSETAQVELKSGRV
jgi:hypothetical protein